MKPAARRQYGQLNYSEGGTSDRWGAIEAAFRGAADEFNVGQVYRTNDATDGGVLPGDSGMMMTRNMWYGIVRVVGAPQPPGIARGNTVYSQWGGTPDRWDGDAPLSLHPQIVIDAPWRKNYN